MRLDPAEVYLDPDPIKKTNLDPTGKKINRIWMRPPRNTRIRPNSDTQLLLKKPWI